MTAPSPDDKYSAEKDRLREKYTGIVSADDLELIFKLMGCMGEAPLPECGALPQESECQLVLRLIATTPTTHEGKWIENCAGVFQQMAKTALQNAATQVPATATSGDVRLNDAEADGRAQPVKEAGPVVTRREGETRSNAVCDEREKPSTVLVPCAAAPFVPSTSGALQKVVADNLPYLENLILPHGHESPVLRHHPAPCKDHTFCLMRQAQEGADAIRAALCK